MAILAKLALTSAAGDLTSSAVSIATSTSLVKAGDTATLTNTSGLARTTTSAAAAGNIQATILFRGDDATTNGANKVYLKNMSDTVTEYYTVHVDGEELGRLYSGDWAFFPWAATAGTKASFTLTIAATWAAGDTWEFDGITMTAANSTTGDIAAQIDGLNYPNWTTDHGTGESTIAFTARQSGGLTRSTAVTLDGTLNTAGNGTANITSGAAGTGKSESDISVRPSVHTAMSIEHMLFHQ
tara:strand:- start:10131 stop:10853 length:723 start_codon:yes stop_codon:yes gene_type:complete